MSEPTGVERRIVSVLFADLVGFTPLAESLDPEDVATVQDAYFSAVRDTIARYGGVVEKFIGDAAMAVFGTPRARDDDAERAVRAGLALVAAVEHLGARLGMEAGALELRVGVNSGEVVHAVGGPDAGRVTGDTVNTASRLQAAARPGTVLVGELTALAVGEAIELGPPEPVVLKGKAEPVRARGVLRIRAEPSRDEALGGLRGPLLGRERELAQLEAALTADRPGRVTILAPPGVGKSRLVAELARRAEARGVTVLRGRVRPQAASPFEPVAQLLAAAGGTTRLAAALAGTGASPARQQVVLAEVEALLAPAAAADTAAPALSDLAAERDARFGAWIAALEALAGDPVSACIVEDVHWSGPDLLAFLDRAAEPAEYSGGPAGTVTRRLVVTTARPSLLDTAPEWVARGRLLELPALPAADAAALIEALVGDALPESLRIAVAERSDGNPLFIEELLRAWISVGTLVPEGADEGGGERSNWRLTVEPRQVALPATVQAIYAAQLDDLPADARLVARRASVAGRRFAEAAFAPLELRDPHEGLATLRRRAFVAGPQHDPAAGNVYAYRHALLRDAGYASLARVERARLHAALARWLDETAGGGDQVAALVAEHYASALESLPALGGDGGPSRDELRRLTAEAYERAASASLAVAAHEEAVRLLQRAIEHTPPDAPVDLARRRLRLGGILADSGDLAVGVAEMQAASDALAARLPEAAVLYGDAVYRLARAHMQQIRFDDAEAATAAALERLGDRDPAAAVRLTALHAWAVAAQGRDEGAGDDVVRARKAAAALGDPALEVDVLEHYAATLDELDRGDDDAWDELERRARELGRWRQAVVAARVRGVIAAESDRRGALRTLDAAAELADAHGMTEQAGWCDLSRCETLWVLGRWDEALAAGDRAISLAQRHAYDRLLFRTWVVVLPLVAARRDSSWLDRFEPYWAAADPLLPRPPSPYAQVLRAGIAIWVALGRGAALEAIAPPPAQLAPVVPPMCNPHVVAAGEVVAASWVAHGRLAAAETIAATFGSHPTATPLMRISASLVRSWLATARRAPNDANAAAREAADAARAHGAPWWEARALRALGEDASPLEHRLGIPA